MSPDREMLMTRRVLFYKLKCPYCKHYLEFIESVNLNLPIEKRIEVIDCSRYMLYGEITHPLIRVYKKWLNMGVPVLFFEGGILSGANSRQELEAFIKTKCFREFVAPMDMSMPNGNSYLPRIDCEFVEREGFVGKIKDKLFGREVQCN